MRLPLWRVYAVYFVCRDCRSQLQQQWHQQVHVMQQLKVRARVAWLLPVRQLQEARC